MHLEFESANLEALMPMGAGKEQRIEMLTDELNVIKASKSNFTFGAGESAVCQRSCRVHLRGELNPRRSFSGFNQTISDTFQSLRPPFRVCHSSSCIHRFAAVHHLIPLASVTLVRRHKLYAAVLVLMVVPARKLQHPSAGIGQGRHNLVQQQASCEPGCLRRPARPDAPVACLGQPYGVTFDIPVSCASSRTGAFSVGIILLNNAC